MRRVVARVLLVILLVSMLYSAFRIMPAQASGIIYIRADGSIDPQSAPIQRSGNLYTLTANVQNCIVIQKDNVIVDGRDFTLQDLGNGTGIDLTGRRNVTISNIEITGCLYGIKLNSSSNNFIFGNNINYSALHGIALFSSSNNNTISGNKITYNYYEGIFMNGSSYNAIFGNNIKGNNEDGISVSYYSSSNTISGNNITDNMEHGIALHYSSNNNISGNTLENNFVFDIFLDFSSSNIFYHNNIYDRAYVTTYSLLKNTWDDGYPAGGNYWSDYKGKDLHSGPYQNKTGSDGIGDTAYTIATNNVDHYPLMTPTSIPCTLTIAPTNGGKTNPTSGAYIINAGTSKQVIATPDTGYKLTHWVFDGSLKNPANPINILMNSSHIVQATFAFVPSVTISPSSAIMDLGQTQTFNSTSSGGTPPYTYEWYLNGNAVYSANDPTWGFTPTSTGNYQVYLNVTDAASKSAASNTTNVLVNPALSVALSPISVSLDVGQSSLFTSSVSGGTYPYSYQWYLNGSLVLSGISSSWMFNPSSAGFYTVSTNVTDNVGVVAESRASSATVNPALSASISPHAITIDVGQSLLFTSSVSGGTSPYTYQWYLNGNTVRGATNSSWIFTPNSPNSYNVYVKVTDSVNLEKESNIATIFVNPALSVSLLPASVVMDAGQSQLFTSTISGGTSLYYYQWYLNSTLVSGATNSTWTFTPTSPGACIIYVIVTDDAGMQVGSNDATVTVNGPLSVIITPTSMAMDVGQQQLFTCRITGGTFPYNYQWYLNGDQVSGATSSTWVFSSTSTGSYTVCVSVTDNATNHSNAQSNTAFVTVNSAPSVKISPSSIIINVGQSQLFTSTISGGTPPYSYQWYLNGVPVLGGTNPTWNWTAPSIGSDSIYVVISDSVKVQATSNTVIVNVKIHDVAIINIIPFKTVVSQGFSADVTVTTTDLGNYNETFNVTVYADATAIASQKVMLSNGSSTTIAFTWNTTGFAYGNYTLSARASPVPGETNTTNNTLTKGNIFVTIQGDANGDRKVNVLDLILIASHLGQKNGGGYAPYSQKWYEFMNCDLNGDGTVNVLDLILCASHMGQHW